MKVTLPNEYEFHNIYSLVSLPNYSTFVIANNTLGTILIARAVTKPLSGGYPIPPGNTRIIDGEDGESVWIKGTTEGMITVNPIPDPIVAPYTIVDMPEDLYSTDPLDGLRRLRVDIGQEVLQGEQGIQGEQGLMGLQGPAGESLNPGTPNSRTISIGTVYQATDTSKPSFVTINTDTSFTAIIGALSSTVELRIGPSSTGLAAGTGGYPVARTRLSLTGILAIVGILLGTGDSLTSLLPAGWYFCVRHAAGSGATIASAYDQSLT